MIFTDYTGQNNSPTSFSYYGQLHIVISLISASVCILVILRLQKIRYDAKISISHSFARKFTDNCPE
jgi:hypothetical protein